MARRYLAVLGIVAVAVVLLANGCTSAEFTEWTGHHIDEVIKKFGPPARTLPTSDGGKMYVWEFPHSVPSASWSNGPGPPTVSTTSTTYVSTKTFWVRPDGIISSWNFQD